MGLNDKRKKTLAKITLFAMTTWAFLSANADWQLDPAASDLYFMSIKATHVGEVHSFDTLSGKVDEKGAASLTIDLASVATLIPIRDQRMRDILFQVDRYPTATVDAQIDLNTLVTMPAGSEIDIELEADLKFKGNTSQIMTKVKVSKLNEQKITVRTIAPVVLSAGQLQVTEGLEKLREIAGLPNISFTIPVTFNLTLTRI